MIISKQLTEEDWHKLYVILNNCYHMDNNQDAKDLINILSIEELD